LGGRKIIERRRNIIMLQNNYKRLGTWLGLAFGTILSIMVAFAVVHSQTTFATNPVIGVIGSAHATNYVPATSILSPGAPLHGAGFHGSSYMGLAENLIRVSDGYGVANGAEAGSFTFDSPYGHGWQWQLDEVKARTGWFDGVKRLKAVVLSLPGDCLRVPCDALGRKAYLDRVQVIVEALKGQGIVPVVEKYPEWSALNLAQTTQVYNFPYTPTQTEYETLRAEHSARFAPYLIDDYKGYTTRDGFHPDEESGLRAARRVKHYLEDKRVF
jgi:hypothetical protein